VTAAIAALAAVALVLAAALVRSRRTPRLDGRGRVERILVPFAGGALDERVLAAANRIARAENATQVPA
jgi:hypothetical protein